MNIELYTSIGLGDSVPSTHFAMGLELQQHAAFQSALDFQQCLNPTAVLGPHGKEQRTNIGIKGILGRSRSKNI
jgi:hypothetical protein